jgi:short subunit dehydrogenase-like uncharacterized protein
MTQQWMIYGAYGYTGELMAREAVRRGLRPVLAGRNGSPLARVAATLGLEYRVFDVSQAEPHLADIAVLLNCAGPYSVTARPLVAACLAQQVHYVDVNGEIDVHQHCRQLRDQARARGVILCPGSGFATTPTDCLAAQLKERLPDCRRIDLAFSFGTRPSIGTIKTTVEGIRVGGLVRCDHQLRPVPTGYRIRRIAFQDRPRWCVTIPWVDVYTSGISTGVPDGMVYTALPLAVGVVMRLTSFATGFLALPFMQRWLTRLAERFLAGGPDEQQRRSHRTQFWGEASTDDGRTLVMTMAAPSVYALSVDVALDITLTCLASPDLGGHFTPSMLMGSDYMARRPGVELRVANVGDAVSAASCSWS